MTPVTPPNAFIDKPAPSNPRRGYDCRSGDYWKVTQVFNRRINVERLLGGAAGTRKLGLVEGTRCRLYFVGLLKSPEELHPFYKSFNPPFLFFK